MELEIIRNSISLSLHGFHVKSGIQLDKDNRLLRMEKLTKDKLKDIVATVIRTGGPATPRKAREG